MIDSLRGLRNKAAHLARFDETEDEQAFAYGVLAIRVVMALDNLLVAES